MSIGTFGITTLRSDPEENHPQTPTPEQVQEEFISYLDTEEEEDDDDNNTDPVYENRNTQLQRSISGTLSRGKEKSTTVIKKKSLTFLLKKMFTSRNRLNHVSLARDSLPDPTFDKSRMEKVCYMSLFHVCTCTVNFTRSSLYLLISFQNICYTRIVYRY